jgi:hypothetical protein
VLVAESLHQPCPPAYPAGTAGGRCTPLTAYDVSLGSPIVLKVRGFPKEVFQAKVGGIAPIAVTNGAERKLMVRSELENERGLLKTEMTGVGKIYCGKRTIANLLTRRAIRWIRTEFWEYIP